MMSIEFNRRPVATFGQIEFAEVLENYPKFGFLSSASVLTAEQPGEVAYVVLSGTLRVSSLRADGREVILALSDIERSLGN